MLRRALLAAALTLVPAFALAAAPTWTTLAPRSVRGTCATGTCSDAPTLVSQGMNLEGVGGVTVHVCADSGQTLSGAGTLQAYVWNDQLQYWSRLIDRDLSVTHSAYRCQAFDVLWVGGPRGRLAFVPSGVTVSSGGLIVDHLSNGPQPKGEAQ
jgi:hypothetical protein